LIPIVFHMIKTCKLKLFIYEQLITAADTNTKGTYRKNAKKNENKLVDYNNNIQQHSTSLADLGIIW